jgi:hypothetical protein
VKNATNTYGYYLTEDSETIEFRGNFEENVLFLRTKNPDEQLNYKVFVSPKKTINFAIQIVGGSNPQTVYIPQHIYKDLKTAYIENNPYFTIKDITIIKLDFTDTGNTLIKYLKEKFELGKGTDLSKILNAGSTGISNYAGFDASGNPVDEDILKQILYLYEEQNDIIFVDKDVELVTEDIVKNRGYKSNRILGDFSYISNYFDKTGKFNSNLLNSRDSIKIETATINSILQLNEFVKDNSGKTLQDVNSIYKNNITVEEAIINAPKVLGLVMSGLSKVAPLVGVLRDKVSQLNAQSAQKKLEEEKALGGSLRGQLEGGVDGIRGQLEGGLNDASGQVTDGIDKIKGLFSTSKQLVSQYKTSVSLKAEGGLSNQFTIPSANGLSNKFAIPSVGTSNPFNIPTAPGVSNPFNIPTLGSSNRFNIPGASGVSNPFNIQTAPGISNPFSVGGSGASNRFNIPGASGTSNSFSVGGLGNKFPISNSIKTISTIGNVSLTEGTNMIKNAAGQSAESLKAVNADFLKF